jgi:hypothetical protein
MKRTLFILLLLCSIHFWGFVYLPVNLFKLTNALSLLVMGIQFLMTLGKKSMHFRTAIIVFMVGLVINIFAAYFNSGQHLRNSFFMFGPFYFILFYFSLHQMEIERKYLENIIIVFAVLYSIFYLLQLFTYPRPIFYSDMIKDRGTIRLRIEGNGVLVRAYFLLLNRYLMHQKFSNAFLMGLFFLILLKGGFRSLTFATMFLTVLMTVRLFPYVVKNFLTIILLMFLFAGVLYSRGASAILKNMISTTQKQKNEGQNYIRARCLNYYYTIYPENKSYFFFGGGFSTGTTLETRKHAYIEDKFGFYWADLGLLGFYIVVGAVACLGLVWYSVKALLSRVPKDMMYLNFYFLYLLMVSFTTMEIYRGGVFAVEAIVLYLIDINRIKKKPKTPPELNP